MGEYNSSHYLHYICTDCRIGSKSMQDSIKCPHCGKQMTEVPVIFKIPKKTDNKAWDEVKERLIHGTIHRSRWWVR